ncbi:MAG: transposase [Burkholderiales bacterium]|nr:transposase [Burkholderiales bacterium]
MARISASHSNGYAGTSSAPRLANKRPGRNAKGQVVLELKSPYRDGTTHMVMHAQQFMQRLAALIPRPRLHPIRFHAVLAPHAKLCRGRARCRAAGERARARAHTRLKR